MKIQCSGCEAAEAQVMCCADEAALCLACDDRVHAANKLAGKHQRVPLLAPSRLPKCDICQEASGYFFCLEDRALFCRNCDVSIHTANSFVSSHRRFLVTGVQVGLEPAEPIPSVAKEQPSSAGRTAESPRKALPKANSSLPIPGNSNQQLFPTQALKDTYFTPAKPSYSGANMVGCLPDWSIDDLFGFTDFNQKYGFPENGSSKADSGKLGSSESSPPFPADRGVDFDECLGQVPELSYNRVPEISSPPTASGLHWHRNLHFSGAEHALFVPDISSHSFQGYQGNPKRRRPC